MDISKAIINRSFRDFYPNLPKTSSYTTKAHTWNEMEICESNQPFVILPKLTKDFQSFNPQFQSEQNQN